MSTLQIKRHANPFTHCHLHTPNNYIVRSHEGYKSIIFNRDKRKKDFPTFYVMAGRVWCIYIPLKSKRNTRKLYKNQREHHRIKTFREEYIELFKEH